MGSDWIVIGDLTVRVDCAEEPYRGWLRKNWRSLPALSLRSDRSSGALPDLIIQIKAAQQYGESVLLEWDEPYSRAILFARDRSSLDEGLMQAFETLLLSRRWGLVLNASAVVFRGFASLIIGNRIVRELIPAGFRYLSRSAAIVQASDEGAGARVYPLPDGDLDGDDRPEPSYPLRDVHIWLSYEPANQELLPQASAYALLSAMYEGPLTAEWSLLCRKLTMHTPAYRYK